MTFSGHILTGAALGVASLPRDSSRIRKAIHMVVFAFLSLIPDLPIEYWGHGRYYSFSHSLFVNLGIILALALLFLALPGARRRAGGWTVLAAGAAAWLTHLLLDSFYSAGLGIAIFWPLSKARLALPVPWLGVIHSPAFPLTPEKMRVMAIETITFLPLLGIALLARRWVRYRN